MSEKPFLKTVWSNVAMLNYEVEPTVLRPLVPAGTELDCFGGRTFVSLVGFLYADTRVWGAAIPWHRSFAEVNLRFYVRRLEPDGWRRGVVFVKEIVPRWAVALVARLLYDEKFVALPMRHSISPREGEPHIPGRVEYGWKFAGRWQRLAVETTGEGSLVCPGSEEEFITEHYWGYTARRDGTTSEYRVDHPPWQVWQANRAELDCDVARLYGPQFAEPLAARPASAFLAQGSPVSVYPGRRLAGINLAAKQLSCATS
jgi:uncharacterized protein YqjF (DUF2071 family)